MFVVATLLVVGLTDGGVGTAAAWSPPPRVDLAGTVTLEGSGPGAFPVHVPRPATIATYPPDVSVHGNGRVVGFVLHQDGGWNTVMVSFERYGFCTTPGCAPSVPSANGGLYDPRTGHPVDAGTVPPGDYHMYLIADAAPAVVTLHFHGLNGSLVLGSSGPAPVEIVTAPTTVSLPPGPTGPMDYGAGVTRSVPTGAATGIAMWADSPLPSEGNSDDVCVYRGGPPPPYPAYQYPCEGAVCCMSGTGGSFQFTGHGGVLGLTGEYRNFEDGGVLVGPGTWGIGATIQSADLVTDAHVVEAWVRFDDPTGGVPAVLSAPAPRTPLGIAPAAPPAGASAMALPSTDATAGHSAGASVAAASLALTVLRWRRRRRRAR